MRLGSPTGDLTVGTGSRRDYGSTASHRSSLLYVRHRTPPVKSLPGRVTPDKDIPSFSSGNTVGTPLSSRGLDSRIDLLGPVQCGGGRNPIYWGLVTVGSGGEIIVTSTHLDRVHRFSGVSPRSGVPNLRTETESHRHNRSPYGPLERHGVEGVDTVPPISRDGVTRRS